LSFASSPVAASAQRLQRPPLRYGPAGARSLIATGAVAARRAFALMRDRRTPVGRLLMTTHAFGLPDTIVWHGRRYPTPSEQQIEHWVFDSVCETPDGDTVEPDHPDSWLCLLGLI
jgi:hypothetical protein